MADCVPVSVIVPCYCCVDTIERAVVSIAGQSKLPAEVILVDDASPDGGATLGKIHELKTRYTGSLNINVIHLDKNKGPSGARNAGWDAASQSYIAFLDADDAWHPKKLEFQYSFMRSNESICLSGHAVTDGYAQGDKLEREYDFPEVIGSIEKIKKYNIIFSNPFATSSVMMIRDVARRFEIEKKYIEDYYLWLALFFDGYVLAYMDVPLGCRYKRPFGEIGLSANLWQMEKGELDCFLRLYKHAHLSKIELLLCSAWSMVKYLRRIMVSVKFA